MAENENDTRLINKTQTGFPPHLDFVALRAEGIGHLGNLAGKIWTDHNVHDPGITILETLCYALLDLGYRTQLPAKDLFASNPALQQEEDNFFTPAQLLTINPLTITDYRKLLVDIEGVKNAWVFISRDQNAQSFCNRYDRSATTGDRCVEYLNGLYHVYIDLEKNTAREFGSGMEPQRAAYEKQIIDRVRKALLSHRNLCEDFISIKILCKWEIGVCAAIELEDDADPEQVYMEMVTALRQFFSPSPVYYTLQQLLDNGRSIDEIFSGRAFDTGNSHGFVDTAAFEALTLKRSIHVSDIYSVLFAVKGIGQVQRLRMRTCDPVGKSMPDKWSITVPEDHISDFSVTCSGFEFTRNGIPVSFDFRKYDSLLEINFEHNGKILYEAGADALDLSVPRGTFYKEVGLYNSLQQEFPKVYGIAHEGLPPDASVERKAQSLQLKGYLLFFDQLLADYLGQLKNLRSLFSRKSAQGNGMTYFTNVPSEVSEFYKLVGYRVNGNTGTNTSSGMLAVPVDKKMITAYKEQDKLNQLDIEHIPWFVFHTQTAQRLAVSLVQEDILQEEVIVETVVRNNDCVYYLVYISSEEFVLVGKKYFANTGAALLDAATLKFAASDATGFKKRNLDNGYSFYIELGNQDYSSFIQKLAEDESLYHRRRQSFLDHLLSRFSERFTDYALLSYGLYAAEQLQANNNLAKERFLQQYPLLSATRGRAFNYAEDGWHTGNNSGMEKRIRAFLGHGELERKTLCNFAVYEYAEKYIFRLMMADGTSFDSDHKYDTRELAADEAAQLAVALKDPENYRLEKTGPQEAYQVRVKYGARDAYFSRSYPSQKQAAAVASGFRRLADEEDTFGRVEPASFSYHVSLDLPGGKKIRTLPQTFDTEDSARRQAVKLLGRINDPDTWQVTDETIHPGKLARPPKDVQGNRFVDVDIFKMDIDNTILGKPDKYNFELLDKENRFKFISLHEFENEKKAKDACLRTMSLLAEKERLHVAQDENGRWNLWIRDNGDTVAVIAGDLYEEHEARQWEDLVWRIVEPHVFELSVEAVPRTWRFEYETGYDPEKSERFRSAATFESEDDSIRALNIFREKVAAGESLAGITDADEPGLTQLRMHQQFRRLTDPQHINIDVHEDSKCRYVYHLVDKDGVYARLHTQGTTKAQVETERLQAIAGSGKDYNVLELLLTGNMIQVDNGSFYYELRSANKITSPMGQPATEVVLFRSVAGYSSRTDAEEAFARNYLRILSLAQDENNYGEGKPVSLFRPGTADACPSDDTIVYIPAETFGHFGSYPQQAVKAMIAVVLSYPVRLIESKGKDPMYRFVLFDKYVNAEIWTGVNAYASADAAMNAFRFFLLLLKYEGNYYIDCDMSGTYGVYLREVLAESTDRFLTEALAWGKTGVQKFILASQNNSTFHPFSDERCCHSFFVACENLRVVHPCTYDTPQQRDAALILLQKSLPAILQWKFDGFCEGWNDLIRDFNGEQVARVRIERPDAVSPFGDYLTGYAELMGYILKYGLCIHEEKNEVYLMAGEGHTIHFMPVPSPETDTLHKLKNKLLWLAEYFPFVIRDKRQQEYRYGIEIRLPGFDKCEAAWVTVCDYSECDVLMQSYRIILSWLFNFNLYRPVFECPCGPYGIELYDISTSCVSEREQDDGRDNQREKKISLSRVIAVNPQCYPSAEQVCESIERAKKLINSEGLHLVEHILLRPHCEEDCQCVLTPCANEFDKCEFPPWQPQNDDPCTDLLPVCFRPGHDPYSFLATVALPAWPERFRKKENRQIVEQMLHREAPAHIALRVLWLTPHDLCCFESHFKRWLRWTAYKTSCRDGYTTCEWVNFLFRREFECWVNREVCDTCGADETQESCVDEIRKEEKDADRSTCHPQSWLEQISELHCWQQYNCSETFYLNCDATSPGRGREPNINRFVNSRYAAYRKSVESVDVAGAGDIVAKARRFLDTPAPAFAAFNKIIAGLLSAYEHPESAHAELQKRAIYQVIADVTHYYLDKLIFDNRHEEIDALQKTTVMMKAHVANIQEIYTRWSREGIREAVPDAPLERIQRIFTV